MLQQLKARYGQYEQEARQVRERARPTDGLFGMGSDPRKDACHDRFYEDVGRWAEAFLAAEPDPDDAAEAAEWILRAAADHRDQETYWYMYAAQGHAKKLICRMPPQRCAALAAWYDGAYPPIERMPVQKEIFKLLRRYGKAKK